MYDAIVVGARCAGAATAMLLAREGREVLLVDRARFPSDIPHGHFIHRHGPKLLSDWGLLQPVLDTNCPAITTLALDQGDFPLVGTELEVDGVPMGLGPRRSRLDEVLVDAAVKAGAELREGFAVQGYTSDGDHVTGIRGGSPEVSEQATIVIGADGRNSGLARYMGASSYEDVPTISCWYFSYWGGVAAEGLELFVRDERAVFVFPTNDDLTAIFVAWPIAELPRVKADIEGEMMKVLDAIPGLGERVRAGQREERLYGATQLPNFLRRPHGPGWALVGDAGCHKDPLLALGVCDARRDAGLLADALSGGEPVDEALTGYERRRNEATMPDYQLNLELAKLQAAPPEAYALRAALRGNQEDTNSFFRARQGLAPPETFFNEENMARVMSGG